MRALTVVLFWSAAALAAGDDKANVSNTPVETRFGLKIPGIQIPYSRLVSEAEFPIKNALLSWILVNDTILVPGTDRTLGRIDVKSNKWIDPIDGVDQPCAGAVEAFKSLWVPDCANGTIQRLDPKTGKPEASVRAGVARAKLGVASTADSIWALTDKKTTLSRIDPDTSEVVAELRLPSGCSTVSFGEGALWATCPHDELVLRVDTTRNLIQQWIKVAGEPWAIATGEGSIWVLCRKSGVVDRIDPKTNKVVKSIELAVPAGDGNIAVGLGSVWVSSPGFPLTRIDARAERVVQQFSGESGGAIQTGFGSVWLANPKRATLSRLDPKRIAATLE